LYPTLRHEQVLHPFYFQKQNFSLEISPTILKNAISSKLAEKDKFYFST